MNQILKIPELTPEDMFSLPNYNDHRYELEDGRLTERTMSMEASWIGGRTQRLLGNHCDATKEAWVLDSENTYQCFPDKPRQVRRADASVIRAGRVSKPQFHEGHVRVVPDLVAEVVSPNEIYYETTRRIKQYLLAGVRLMWIINPEDKTVLVYRANGSITGFREQDELSGEEVLPTFRCKVSDLFPPPELLATLTTDEQANLIGSLED